jgi:4-amino-4-deoxy-L-arabinose transferase-like glycosyltransferase
MSAENFSREEALLTMAVALFNPFLVFNGASFFSHLPCLFFSTLAIYFAFRILRDPERHSYYVGLGSAAAVAFLIRPYTALTFLAAIGVLLPFHISKPLTRRQVVVNILLAMGPLVAAAGLLSLYNVAQGGDPLAGPYAQYDSAYRLGRSIGSPDWSWALRHNLTDRLVELTIWIPLSFVLLVAFCSDRTLRGDPRRRLLLLSFAGLLAGYFMFLQDPGNQYGPRYVFESCGAVMLLMGGVLRRWGRLGIVLAFVIVCCNVMMLTYQTREFASQVRDRIEVYETAKREKLTRAVVFLRTGSGSMPPGDLTRNGISFTGDVLYVHDRGVDNPRMIERHPNRRAFFYTFDWSTRRGSLTPY